VHELSIARAVLEIALRHASDRPVVRVDLSVGALRQVVPDSLEFCFEIAARETPCEGAALAQTLVPARMRCRACGGEWDPAPAPAEDASALVAAPSFRCPSCRAAGGEVIAGEELVVESIEVEDPEASLDNAGTAPTSRPGA
jgi:hydrogenase nickel incorporation protein HypA/HybF